MSKSTRCTHGNSKTCNCPRVGNPFENEESGALVPTSPRIARSLARVNAAAPGRAGFSFSSIRAHEGKLIVRGDDTWASGTEWRLTLHRSGDPHEDSAFLLQQLQPVVTHLTTAARSKEVLADRARLVEIISVTYQELLVHALGIPGEMLFERLATRQRLVRPGVTIAAESQIETIVLVFSDLLAALKDPGHRTAKSHRRTRIARRPYSALPLFAEPVARRRNSRQVRDTQSVILLTVVDRDLLEWVEEPYLFKTSNDDSGNPHSILAPAPNTTGDITLRQYCLWQGLSRATEYKIGERKRSGAGGRITKEDPDVPGLREGDRGLVVNLEAHVLTLIERRTTRWSKAAAAAAPKVLFEPRATGAETIELSAEAGDEDQLTEPETCSRQVTPTEDMLAYLEVIDRANIERHRLELLPKIEEERRNNEFIVLALRMAPPAITSCRSGSPTNDADGAQPQERT